MKINTKTHSVKENLICSLDDTRGTNPHHLVEYYPYPMSEWSVDELREESLSDFYEWEERVSDWKNFLRIVKKTPAEYFKNRPNQHLIYINDDIFYTLDYSEVMFINPAHNKTNIILDIEDDIEEILELY